MMSVRLFQCVLVIALSLIAAPSPAHGQADSPVTPEVAAKRALDALHQDRTRDYANAMHPEALRQFRTVLMAVVHQAVSNKKSSQVLPLFGGVKSVADLKKLDDVGFFHSYLQGLSALLPHLKPRLAKTRSVPLGHVAEGSDVVHLVIRTDDLDVGENVLGSPTIISMKKAGENWRMLLSGDVSAMVEVVRRGLSGKPDKAPPLEELRTQIRALGHFLLGADKAWVVYRSTAKLGAEPATTKLYPLLVKKSDPAWAAVMSGDRDRLTEALTRKLGLDK